MPPIIPPHRLILISTILIPTSFVLARTYIYFSPSAKLSPRLAEPIAITTTLTLTPTTASSLTHRIINPKNHKSSTADSYTATIPGALVAHLSDQEILARFFHGYFNGWSFVPEWCLLGTLGFFGRILIPVEYTEIEPSGTLFYPARLSRSELPQKHTLLFGGNFMILDSQTSALPSSDSNTLSPSFVEIGFGSNRRQFSGLHRFEVFRHREVGENEEKADAASEAVTISYSSTSCNPSVDRLPFPEYMGNFHRVYSWCLFRDGVRGILKI